jgi:hypothetical protein
MAVGQVSLSVRQVFARAGPPASAMAVISAAAKQPRDFMLVNLSWPWVRIGMRIVGSTMENSR